jgi:3-methylcrotonyl-CoA carboxylase alpha subunit
MRLRAGDGTLHAVEAGPPGLAVERVSDGAFVATLDGRRVPFHCVRDGARVWLSWAGTTYVLEEETEDARGPQRGQAHGLEAPMPGRVIAVRVEPGQAVVRGQEVLVVEAMKMENAVRAPRDGVVKSVAAAVGDMVSPGTVLVELE